MTYMPIASSNDFGLAVVRSSIVSDGGWPSTSPSLTAMPRPFLTALAAPDMFPDHLGWVYVILLLFRLSMHTYGSSNINVGSIAWDGSMMRAAARIVMLAYDNLAASVLSHWRPRSFKKDLRLRRSTSLDHERQPFITWSRAILHRVQAMWVGQAKSIAGVYGVGELSVSTVNPDASMPCAASRRPFMMSCAFCKSESTSLYFSVQSCRRRLT